VVGTTVKYIADTLDDPLSLELRVCGRVRLMVNTIRAVSSQLRSEAGRVGTVTIGAPKLVTKNTTNGDLSNTTTAGATIAFGRKCAIDSFNSWNESRLRKGFLIFPITQRRMIDAQELGGFVLFQAGRESQLTK
jgi:hypothetical protein